MHNLIMFPSMPTPKRHDLPNRVRHFREARGLNLRQLAATLGLAHGSLARIETGKQELSHYWMEKIGAALEVEPADLLNPVDGGLSADERRMIDTYREIPEANRRVILGVMESQQAYRGEPDVAELNPAKRA